jgi:hypothetical protein
MSSLQTRNPQYNASLAANNGMSWVGQVPYSYNNTPMSMLSENNVFNSSYRMQGIPVSNSTANYTQGTISGNTPAQSASTGSSTATSGGSSSETSKVPSKVTPDDYSDGYGFTPDYRKLLSAGGTALGSLAAGVPMYYAYKKYDGYKGLKRKRDKESGQITFEKGDISITTGNPTAFGHFARTECKLFGDVDDEVKAVEKAPFLFSDFVSDGSFGVEDDAIEKIVDYQKTNSTANPAISYDKVIESNANVIDFLSTANSTSNLLSSIHFEQKELGNKIQSMRQTQFPNGTIYNNKNILKFRFNENFAEFYRSAAWKSTNGSDILDLTYNKVLSMQDNATQLLINVDKLKTDEKSAKEFNSPYTKVTGFGDISFRELVGLRGLEFGVQCALNCFEIDLTSDMCQQIACMRGEMGSIDVVYRRIADVAYAAMSVYLNMQGFNLQTRTANFIEIQIVEIPVLLNIVNPQDVFMTINYQVIDDDEIQLYYPTLASRVDLLKRSNSSLEPSLIDDDNFLYNSRIHRIVDITKNQYDGSGFEDNAVLNAVESAAGLWMINMAGLCAPPKEVDFNLSARATASRNLDTLSIRSISTLPFLIFQQSIPYAPEVNVKMSDDYNVFDNTRHDVFTGVLQKALPMLVDSQGNMKNIKTDINARRRFMTITANGACEAHFYQITNDLSELYNLNFRDHVSNMLLILAERSDQVPREYVNDYSCLINLMKVNMAVFQLDSGLSILLSIAGVKSKIYKETIEKDGVSNAINKQYTFDTGKDSSGINTFLGNGKKLAIEMNEIYKTRLQEGNTQAEMEKFDKEKKEKIEELMKSGDTECVFNKEARDYVTLGISRSIYDSLKIIKFHPYESDTINGIDTMRLLGLLMLNFKPPKVGIQSYNNEECFDSMMFISFYYQVICKAEYIFQNFANFDKNTGGVIYHEHYANFMAYLNVILVNVFFALFIRRSHSKKYLFDRFTMDSCVVTPLNFDTHDDYSFKFSVFPPVNYGDNIVCPITENTCVLRTSAMYQVLYSNYKDYMKIIMNGNFPIHEIPKMNGMMQTLISSDPLLGYPVCGYGPNQLSIDQRSSAFIEYNGSLQKGVLSNTQILNLMIIFSRGLNYFTANTSLLPKLMRQCFYIFGALNQLSHIPDMVTSTDRPNDETCLLAPMLYYREQILTKLRNEETDEVSLILYALFGTMTTFHGSQLSSLFGIVLDNKYYISNMQNENDAVIQLRANSFLFENNQDKFIYKHKKLVDIVYTCETILNMLRRVTFGLYCYVHPMYIHNYYTKKSGRMEEVELLPASFILEKFDFEKSIQNLEGEKMTIDFSDLSAIRNMWAICQSSIAQRDLSVSLVDACTRELGISFERRFLNERTLKGLPCEVVEVFDNSLELICDNISIMHRVFNTWFGKFITVYKFDQIKNDFLKSHLDKVKKLIGDRDSKLELEVDGSVLMLAAYEHINDPDFNTADLSKKVLSYPINGGNSGMKRKRVLAYDRFLERSTGIPNYKTHLDVQKIIALQPSSSPHINDAKNAVSLFQQRLNNLKSVYEGGVKRDGTNYNPFLDENVWTAITPILSELVSKLGQAFRGSDNVDINWATDLNGALGAAISADGGDPSRVANAIRNVRNRYALLGAQEIQIVVDNVKQNVSNELNSYLNTINRFLGSFTTNPQEKMDIMESVNAVMRSGATNAQVADEIRRRLTDRNIPNGMNPGSIRNLLGSQNPLSVQSVENQIVASMENVLRTRHDIDVNVPLITSIVGEVINNLGLQYSSPDAIVNDVYTKYNNKRIIDAKDLGKIRLMLNNIIGSSYAQRNSDAHQSRVNDLQDMINKYGPKGSSMPPSRIENLNNIYNPNLVIGDYVSNASARDQPIIDAQLQALRNYTGLISIKELSEYGRVLGSGGV